MGRYCFMVALSLISVSCHLGFSAHPAQSYPSKEVSLSDWGLSDPSQIGHLSIGILHKKNGDEMVLYDIRKQKPVLKTKEGPRSRVPYFDNDFFLVSHFNQGNINRLGGYFNGFSKPPSKSIVSISKTGDREPALTYEYKNIPPGFAGFWVHLFDFKLPPSERVYLNSTPFSYLTFSIRSENENEKLMLRMADRSYEKKEDSLLASEISSLLPQGKIKRDWQTAWFPLSQLDSRLNRKELANVVFQTAGNGSGRIYVKDLAFTTKRDISILSEETNISQTCPSNKAMWLWETNKILRNAKEWKTFFEFIKKQEITDLFVQIPYEAEKNGTRWSIIWDSAEMRPFLSKLNREGIRVHALDGDPRFALKEWHGRSIALLKKIIQYNDSVSNRERFHGIRYDNEPYLLPQFGGVRKESVLKQYLELAEKSQTLARQAGLTFGVDIPFWFDSYNEFFEPAANLNGRPMSERIIDVVDNVGIMDYRTVAYGADGVIEHGTNELRYAARKGKKVFIGLETVWLPDETIYNFGTEGSGSRVLIETVDSKKIQVTFIPKGKPINTGKALVLHQTRQVKVPSSKLTFYPKKPEDLEEVIRHSKQELCQFSSFHGFVIHSYESYRPWLEKHQPSLRAKK